MSTVAGDHGVGSCPLCHAGGAGLFDRDEARSYWRCGRCALIFVPGEARLDSRAEKARYDTHRNDPGDPAYRAFLSRLAVPLLERVPEGAQGLDFGCGPGPALAAMLNERGRPTRCYDPYYAPDETVWSRSYDFITATEVFEHLYRPAAELERLFRSLVPGGWLGVMTRQPPDAGAFAAWHYRRDPTHVCFYGCETFLFIAERWHAEAHFEGDDVVLLRKRIPFREEF